MKKMMQVLLAGVVFLSSGCSAIRSRAEKSSETLRSTLGITETADPYRALETQMKQSGKALVDSRSDALKALLKDSSLTAEDAADWYDTSLEEFRTFTDGLGEQTTQYYQLILDSEDMNSYKKWNGRLEDWSDAWDDVLEDTYDDLYDLFLDAYDDFYEEVGREKLSDAYDTDTMLLGDLYSETWTWLFTYETEVWSEFYDGGRNLERCREEADKARTEEHEYSEQRRSDTVCAPLYEIREEGAVITGMASAGNRMMIAESYEGSPVVGIAAEAFAGCADLHEISLPESLQYIDASAFRDCTGLRDLYLPESVERIGAHAFENCTSLNSLALFGTAIIEDYAFAGDTGIRDLFLDRTAEIGAHAFEGCTGIGYVDLQNVTEIREYVFAGCTSLEEVFISGAAERIRSHAFENCTALEYVWMEETETIVEQGAFAGCTFLQNPPAERVPEVSENTEKSLMEEKNRKETAAPVRTGIRPEFQETMDGYSSFITEYIAFLNTMEESEDQQTMMREYFRYLGELQKQMNALNSLDTSDLSAEENELYLKTVAETTGALLMVLN